MAGSQFHCAFRDIFKHKRRALAAFTVIFKQKRRAVAALVGASATLLTYVWHETYYNSISAEEEVESEVTPNIESLGDNPVVKSETPEEGDGKCRYKKHTAKYFNSATINDKYRKVAPKLFEIIHQTKEHCGSPGISYAVSHNGELVMKGGIGLADVENYTLITSQTKMRIASISKSLTSFAVGKLMEDGLIDINKPIQTYVPTFPHKKFDGEPVTMTLKQCLSHMSGIRGYFDGNTKKEPVDDKARRKREIEVKKYGKDCRNSDENYIKDHYNTVEDGLKLFADDPIIYKPGEDFEYSSLAYSVISRAIEEVSGETFVKYMSKVCKDIAMNSTTVDLNDPIIHNRTSNYNRKSGKTLQNVPYVDVSYKWSGGGFLSNAEDVLKFGNVMLYSSQTDQGYLKKSTVATLWHPEPISFGKCTQISPHTGYALGWFVMPKQNENEKLKVYHTGRAIGASSVLLIIPSDNNNDDSSNTNTGKHPQGTVIALIANMQDSYASLRKAAFRISECLDEYLLSEDKKKKF